MSQSQAQQEADARQAHRRWKAEYHGPDWAKESLSDEGKAFVDDVMLKVNDYMQPPRTAERGQKHFAQDPLVEMVTNWRQDERTSQGTMFLSSCFGCGGGVQDDPAANTIFFQMVALPYSLQSSVTSSSTPSGNVHNETRTPSFPDCWDS